MDTEKKNTRIRKVWTLLGSTFCRVSRRAPLNPVSMISTAYRSINPTQKEAIIRMLSEATASTAFSN